MDSKEREFQHRLLATFRVEAAEHVQAMSSGLFQLAAASSDEERRTLTETVFRAAHSLKGAARAVGEAEIESICHSAEDALSGLKSAQLQLTPQVADVLHDAVDAIARLLPDVGNTSRDSDDVRTAQVVRRIAGAATSAAAADEPGVSRSAERVSSAAVTTPAQPRPDRRDAPAQRVLEESDVLAGSVRIATARLDALLLEAEELLSAKGAAATRAAELRAVMAELAARQKSHAMLTTLSNALERTLAKAKAGGATDHALVQSRRLAELLRTEAGALKATATKLQSLARSSEQDQRTLGAGVDGLLEDMKQVLMLPISSALEILPRLVRDLARDQRKEVELVVTGAEIQIDRRILQAIRDPLVHMVRNSVDHGIELPDARRLAGKRERGTLRVTAARKDGKVELVVSDDGRGIDAAKVRAAAEKAGIAAESGQGVDEENVLPWVFRSGVSTSPMITDVSGRGLGLAIAQEKVETLGGSIAVETRAGGGTAFRMTLPVTLATFRGVHVRVSGHDFIVPTAQVEQALRFRTDAMKSVQNRETLYWNDQTLSVVRLADVLEISDRGRGVANDERVRAIILSGGGARMAFIVDDVLGEQEVLAKPLSKPLVRVRNVAGATVLGSGKPVPILNVSDLLRSAVRVPSVSRPQVQTARAEAGTKSILIAEDSITSRALLKNILESASYRVAAVVDGAEAFARLKTERFDLVVSDVEMPRMDGLELTARIRAEQALADIPVVLVTGLESREHRERGADAGANAYIVKSSFDHGNLLEVVARLL